MSKQTDVVPLHFIAATWERITGQPFSPGSKAEEFARAVESEAFQRMREALAEQQERQQEPVAERHERRVEAHNNVYATEVTVDRLLFLARQGLHSEGDTVGWYEAYFAIDRLFELAKPPAQQEPVAREHITDGNSCWCEPETNYKDPETGISVIVHKEPQ